MRRCMNCNLWRGNLAVLPIVMFLYFGVILILENLNVKRVQQLHCIYRACIGGFSVRLICPSRPTVSAKNGRPETTAISEGV